MSFKETSLKVIIITISLAFIGVLLIVLVHNLGEGNIFSDVLKSLSTILIVSTCWTIIYRFNVQRKLFALFTEKIDQLSYKFDGVKNTNQLGIVGVYNSISSVDITSWINNAKHLNIITYDCEKWIIKHKKSLKSRVENSKSLQFFIPNINRSDMEILSKCLGFDYQYFAEKIARSRDEIKKLFSINSTSEPLSYHEIGFVNYHTVIFTEDKAIIVFQKIAENTNKCQIIIEIEKKEESSCLYKMIINDKLIQC